MIATIRHLLATIRQFITSQKGNAQLLTMAGAIAGTMAIYFFISIASLTQQDKERVAHLYNAYQMGLAVDSMISNRIMLKGENNVSFKDEAGDYRFTKNDFEMYVQMESETEFTLAQLVHEKVLMESRDATASRLYGTPTKYDETHTTLKVIFDMVVDRYDENGDAIKMVRGVHYLVNLAGQSVDPSTDLTNDPYSPDMPFYYLVSYENELAGLTEADITLKYDGIKFKSVLDSSTNGGGPQAQRVIILPGDVDN